MEEIEGKILEVDKEEITKKLEGLGAKKIFDGEILAAYYDFADKKLSDERKMLRLRKKGDAAELTFKEMVSAEKAKIMQEYETKVSNYDEMKIILERIGLNAFGQVSKHRASFVLDGVHFEFDTFPEVPTFLEIEAPDMGALERSVKMLGYSMKDVKPWSGKEVLMHYNKL